MVIVPVGILTLVAVFHSKPGSVRIAWRREEEEERGKLGKLLLTGIVGQVGDSGRVDGKGTSTGNKRTETSEKTQPMGVRTPVTSQSCRND